MGRCLEVRKGDQPLELAPKMAAVVEGGVAATKLAELPAWEGLSLIATLAW